MKTIYKAICVGLICYVANATLTSCNDFINVEPQGVINEELAMSQPNELTQNSVTTGTPIRLISGLMATSPLTMP